MYITILVKQVYWYISRVSGERLQDHWSSGLSCLFSVFCPAGEELLNAGCSDCERGYYKMDSVDARFEPCTQCSGDMITDGTGKTSPDDCIIRKYKN